MQCLMRLNSDIVFGYFDEVGGQPRIIYKRDACRCKKRQNNENAVLAVNGLYAMESYTTSGDKKCP